jgi:hypothetical protein
MRQPERAGPPLRIREIDAPSNRTLGRVGQLAIAGLFVIGAVVGIASRTPAGLFWFIPFAGIGAILVIRRPRTSIGWILMGLGWAYLIVTTNVPGTIEQFAKGTFDSPAELFAVIHNGSIGVLFYLYLLLATVFPSGGLPPGRWGGLGRAALMVGLVFVVAGCVMPLIYASVIGYPKGVWVRNPIAILPDLSIWRLVTPDTAGFPIMFLVLPAAISLVVRVRHSSGTERQQLRWIAASISFVVLAVVAGFVIGTLVPGSIESGLAWSPAAVAFPTVPIAIGIAVLRYRLYEIDRIISRTLAYAALTGALAVIYVAAFIALQAGLAPFTQSGGPLAVAASTLAVFALFQPLRRRLQAAMDRRFNRSRYDAQQTIEAFAGQLRDEVDIVRLGGEIETVIGATLSPASVGVWLRPSRRGINQAAGR